MVKKMQTLYIKKIQLQFCAVYLSTTIFVKKKFELSQLKILQEISMHGKS